MKKFNIVILIICIVLSCAGILNPIMFMKYNQPFYTVGIVLNALAIVAAVVCTVLHVWYYRKHQKESQRFWSIAILAVTLCGIYYMIGQVLFVFR